MAYPSITIRRKAKLEKPMGIGYGRITEGIISDNWDSHKDIRAGSLGLRAITTVILTPGTEITPGSASIKAVARVDSPGSVDNTVSIRAFMEQMGTMSVGPAAAYRVYPTAFTGSPALSILPGSPSCSVGVDIYAGSQVEPFAQTQTPGSFSHQGTPTRADSGFVAVGPGSFGLNFVAVGE